MIGSGIYEWVGSTETGCQLRRNDEYWNGTPPRQSGWNWFTV